MGKSRSQIDLTFHGVKRISANVLASESGLSEDSCNKLAIILFYQDVKKGCIPFQKYNEAMDGENLDGRETHCIFLHR